VVGNLLHNDSFMMRWKNYLIANPRLGICKTYPLLTDDGVVTWKAKYPTLESIDQEKIKTGSFRAFQREYLLKIVPSDDVVIHSEWIQFWEILPLGYLYTIIAADLAISLKTSADYTAILCAHVYRDNGILKICILPSIINKRLTFPETVEHIKSLYNNHRILGFVPKVVSERVGYQESLEKQLRRDGVQAMGVPISTDKRERLSLASPLVESGAVLFPKNGASILIEQLLGFGTEKHDDLVDAFSLLVNHVSAQSGSSAISEYYKEQVSKIEQKPAEPFKQVQRLLVQQYGLYFKGMA
jgi:predicted phage terminase large subunit-like protein